MMERINKLKFVILESPYDTWRNPLAEKLFGRIVGLKLSGYGHEYPYGVISLDTTDFVSDHLVICEEDEQGLKPVLAIRSTSLDQCKLHGLTFPALALMRNCGATEHAMVCEQIMAKAEKDQTDLRYVGSWTISPEHRQNKEWSDVLRELFSAMFVAFHMEKRSQTIAAGTLRFKVDKYVQWLGHQPFAVDGRQLSTVHLKHLAGEENLLTHLTSFSLEARSVSKKWQKLWDERIVIPRDETRRQKTAA